MKGKIGAIILGSLNDALEKIDDAKSHIQSAIQ